MLDRNYPKHIVSKTDIPENNFRNRRRTFSFVGHPFDSFPTFLSVYYLTVNSNATQYDNKMFLFSAVFFSKDNYVRDCLRL